MTDRWMVLLETGPHEHVLFGPFDDEATAEHFADYLTDEVDPAKAIKMQSPVMELIAYYRKTSEQAARQTTADRPMYWPPSPGEIWQDRNGDRWACARVPKSPGAHYLMCLAHQADDSAEEIWRIYGPMQRVQFVAPTLDEEPPF